MTEQFWLSFISLLVTISLALIGILVKFIFSLKKEIMLELKEIRNENEYALNRFCDENMRAHSEIWDRINHHKHTDEGNVVIPS